VKFRIISAILLTLTLVSFAGCAKEADPKRPIEKVRKEAVSMSLARLETRATAYAAAIRAQKIEIEKTKQRIQKMPIKKVFRDKSLTRRIAEIGREAEALFERYQIYAQAFQEKGGDLAKIQIEPTQS